MMSIKPPIKLKIELIGILHIFENQLIEFNVNTIKPKLTIKKIIESIPIISIGSFRVKNSIGASSFNRRPHNQINS